jgi:hypothetical protein
MDSNIGAAGISIVAASTTQNAYIDFTYPGVANRGKLLYSNSLGCMTFTPTAVERMRIDNAGEVMIGSTSSDGIYKLKVIGATYLGGAVTGPTSIATSGAVNCASVAATGAITCATVTATGLITCGSLYSADPKHFDIPHPTKEGYRLRHRCLEGPLAYLYYPYQYDCVVGMNEFELPDYFEAMNSDVLVYVSPFKHFGSGWGETVNNTLHIYCNASGYYNIQVVGTRTDPTMDGVYENNPVEYIPK